MLRPLKKDRKNCYSTLDIETGRRGQVLDIAIFDGAAPVFFSSWAALIQFIEVHIEDKIYHKFIAHNGGSFDYTSFVEYLTDQTAIKYDIVLSQAKIVVLYVYLGGKRIEFIDSANVFLKTSLADLCKIFKIEHGKLEGIDRSNIELLKRNDRDTYYSYLGLDVISLFEVCKSFERLLEIDFFPLTVASLSLYLYRRRFQKYVLMKPRPKVDEFISKAYAGGRVECFRPGKHEVFSFDVNSLYPSVMRKSKFPVGTPYVALSFHPEKIGVYHVRFEQTDRTIPPILWEKNEINGLEFVYSGDGYFFDPEIKLALEHGIRIDIIKGYVWMQSVYLFKEFVDHYYALRMANKGTAIEYVVKLLLNSLYGKFGQKENKKILKRLDGEGLKKALSMGLRVEPYLPSKGLYEVTEPRPINHRIINLAAQVTSLGRVELAKQIIAHPGTIVYCDTDSLHLTEKLPRKLISKKKLGKWKREDSGEGIYTGRKQYSINEKVRFKGMKEIDKLDGGRVVFGRDDLNLINRGVEIEKSFSVFPHIKAVLKFGRKACQIGHITKVMKKRFYLTNFLSDTRGSPHFFNLMKE